MDESHTLRTGDKAPDSGHTEATVKAVKAAEVAVLLTGTPSLSRPFDLYRQVYCLPCNVPETASVTPNADMRSSVVL